MNRKPHFIYKKEMEKLQGQYTNRKISAVKCVAFSVFLELELEFSYMLILLLIVTIAEQILVSEFCSKC